jgi:peptidoglycan/LPS O-acetylase OafA/YrhL
MASETVFNTANVQPAAVATPPARISATVSHNYSVAKVIAIFTVAAGHWFAGSLLWIPVTFGLFVFAFSSAYFTSRLYGVRIDRGRFWRKKLERLGLRYWVILTFLALVVALRGKTVLVWHTLVHYAGLSGVLNWMHIPNRSGLGGGLWFFTLLLIFYFAYPYLAKLGASRRAAATTSIIVTVAAIYLQDHVQVGHELWLTSAGFILGVMFGSHEPNMRAWVPAALALLGCAGLAILNAAFHFKAANTLLITVTSIAIAVWLAKGTLPQYPVMKKLASLETYLLEIFLIHTYLFIHPTGQGVVDFATSMALILVAAVAINRIAGAVTRMVFDRPTALAMPRA